MAELPAGTVLDGVYRLRRLIGRGAMGSVYLGEHMTLGKELAIKVVGPLGAMLPGEEAAERLVREARAASAIEHDNIVDVTHLGKTDDGLFFIVMELLRGENLREHHLRVAAADQRRTVPLDDVLVRDVVGQVLSALEAAHDAGIIHRDLKPENIFLAEKRGRLTVKVVDFGMSKVVAETKNVRLTKTGQILGTPLYMSPEQGKGADEVDARADLYSMGVIAYELLAGEVPFPAETLYECIFKHISEEPPPLSKRRPDLPAGVTRCVHKALAKDPDERFQSASELIDAWQSAWSAEASHDEPEAAPPSSASDPAGPPSQAKRPSPSRYVFVGIGAIAVIGLTWIAASWETTPTAATVPPLVHAPRTDPSAPAEASPSPSSVPSPAEPFLPHTVTIESLPAGARVLVSGVTVGETPFAVTIPQGTESLSVRLERPGYAPEQMALDRTVEGSVRVRLTRRRAPRSPPHPLAPQ